MTENCLPRSALGQAFPLEAAQAHFATPGALAQAGGRLRHRATSRNCRLGMTGDDATDATAPFRGCRLPRPDACPWKRKLNSCNLARRLAVGDDGSLSTCRRRCPEPRLLTLCRIFGLLRPILLPQDRNRASFAVRWSRPMHPRPKKDPEPKMQRRQYSDLCNPGRPWLQVDFSMASRCPCAHADDQSSGSL